MNNLDEFKKLILECGYFDEGKYVVEISKSKLKAIFDAYDVLLV